jgi:hypothetical protein
MTDVTVKDFDLSERPDRLSCQAVALVSWPWTLSASASLTIYPWLKDRPLARKNAVAEIVKLFGTLQEFTILCHAPGRGQHFDHDYDEEFESFLEAAWVTEGDDNTQSNDNDAGRQRRWRTGACFAVSESKQKELGQFRISHTWSMGITGMSTT